MSPEQQPGFTPQAPVTPPQDVQQPPSQQPQPAPIQQPLGQPTYAQPVQQAHDGGHGLGIASLVLSLLGFGLIGLILGIVGLSKSKKTGHTNGLAIAGIVLGAVSMVIILPLVGLTLNNFQGVQARARDTQSMTRLNSLYSKLEEYYNEENAYPKQLNVSEFPGIDSEALKDPTGAAISVVDGAKLATETEATKAVSVSRQSRYQYVPFGCTADKCKGYVLSIYIEKPTLVYNSSVSKNAYTKKGLQNP